MRIRFATVSLFAMNLSACERRNRKDTDTYWDINIEIKTEHRESTGRRWSRRESHRRAAVSDCGGGKT
jgi:hypothetical protein